jgi:xylulose-5-phosphate/fructose-6-phosphate phosphoketolase
MDAYWRAANYLSVGQIYLFDNPLLKRPLALANVKHMLLGHWGTTPGQNFIYVHLNRVIKKYDPDISQDEAGLQKLFLQFSFPGGIPSHASPECPGSIHEGGELGYSLSHSFGAVFDNPDFVVACVVGDGEAETGPLATAWHSSKFLNPATDGAVLPILHLNGYKIANPTLLARISHEELAQLLRGYGWTPLFVEGDEPALMHDAMAGALDAAVEQIRSIQQNARFDGDLTRPRANPGHLELLDAWLKSYRPEELFDNRGRLKPELARLNSKQRNFRIFGPDGRVLDSMLSEQLPDLKVRVVNVVDLMKLQPQSEHPHGLSDTDFDELFTSDRPVIFAFHAYPWLVHRLTYRRTNHDNIHVCGYKEESTITTPFDMTVLNDMDRFHLVMDVIDRVPETGAKGIALKQQLKEKPVEHQKYIRKYGQDMPQIRNWAWGASQPAGNN